MSPDPKPRPIPPIHPDTIAFEKLLGELQMGERVSYDALARLVRKNLRADENEIKAHIQSAERRLRNLRRMIFGPYHNDETNERGRIRLDDAGIVEKAKYRLGQIGKSARRVERIAACADFDKLTIEQRIDQGAVMLSARGATMIAVGRGQEAVRRLVNNSPERIPELANVWKALQNGS